MDYIKLQTEILKKVYNRMLIQMSGKYSSDTMIFEIVSNDTKIDYLYSNGCFIYKIPKSLFLLDIPKEFLKNNLYQFMNTDNTKEAVLTGVTKKYLSNKKNIDIIEFKNGNRSAWINKEYVKYIDLDNCEFLIKEAPDKVYILKHNEVIAVICEIRIK